MNPSGMLSGSSDTHRPRPERDFDAAAKKHPRMVPFDQLPAESDPETGDAYVGQPSPTAPKAPKKKGKANG